MKLELIQPYDMKPIGTQIEMADGIASVLIMRKQAKKIVDTGIQGQSTKAKKSK